MAAIALMHDLTTIAAEVLREPCERFFKIVRRGGRGYFVTCGNQTQRR
jgi:hypothetical protein